ncbi:outer membrane protein assembly factor BamB family protein [Halomicrobium katesii]|uniref:serine/threonine-protein kinase n=1 Tax=Halomicrobium katesii TaxID=437163 RepID=UPI00036880E8|nr:serine/threonine-protein kinase [Halomicrobium katesii]
MEYMDGGDLGEYTEGLSVEGRLWVAERLADAVWYAHHDGGGLIHHDLKPENILFRETPGEQWDVPKIADWELARTLLNHSDSVGVTTPQYVAPEQAHNESTDQLTDQFQLGIVLYELFAGTHPFVDGPESAPEAALITGILRNDPVPLSERRPVVPSALDDVILTMLAKDPDDRYEAMLQVRNDLRSIERGDDRSEEPEPNPTARSRPDSRSVPSQTADWNGVGVGTGVVLDTTARGAAAIRTDLADDGTFYLSDLDHDLEPTQRVSLYYEGDDPGASDIIEVQPVESDEDPPAVGDSETFGEGVVIDTTGDSKAAVETALANDGVFYLSGIEATLQTGDAVALRYEGSDPTASDVSQVVPIDELDQPDAAGAVESDATGRSDSASGSPSATASDRSIRGSWPRFGYDRGRTFHTPDQRGPDGYAAVAWESEIGSGLEASPVVADGTVYAGTTNGLVFALDARTGEKRWHFKTENAVVAAPAVAGDTLYAVSTDAHVYAIDRTAGTERWAHDTGSGIYAPPVVTNDRVVVTSRSGAVSAIHTETGNEMWTVETTPGIRVPVTQYGRRRLLVGDDNGVVHVLTKGGSEQATIDISGRGRIRTPIVAPGNSGTVLVGDTLVDLQRETVVDTLGRGVLSMPAVAEGTAYYVTDTEVRGIEIYSGEQIVSYGFDGSTTRLGTETTPAIADGIVYTGLGDGTVVAFDGATGRKRWRRELGSTVACSPVPVDGHLFAATREGTLYALAERS